MQVAAVGSSLVSIAATSLAIRNTTFDLLDGSASLGNGVNIQRCAQNELSCHAGESCRFTDQSTFCTPCAGNEIGDGVLCTPCGVGTQPNSGHTRCNICEGNRVSTFGQQCDVCSPGTMANDLHTTCKPMTNGETTYVAIIRDVLSVSKVLPAVTLALSATAVQNTGSALHAALVDSLAARSDAVKPSDIKILGTDLVSAKVTFAADFSTGGNYTLPPYISIDQLDSELRAVDGILQSSEVGASIDWTVAPVFSFSCPVGLYRPDDSANCQLCPGGTARPDAANAFRTCIDCPVRMEPYTATADGNRFVGFPSRPDNTSCQCKSETYSKEAFGDIRCFQLGYLPKVGASETGLACAHCSFEQLGHFCVAGCQGSHLNISAGWQGITQDDGEVSIFKCQGGKTVCLGGYSGLNSSNCNAGYTGTLVSALALLLQRFCTSC